jgi:hypothetical protein
MHVHHCCHGEAVHFVVAQVDGDTMTIRPIDRDGKSIKCVNLSTKEVRHRDQPIVIRADIT